MSPVVVWEWATREANLWPPTSVFKVSGAECDALGEAIGEVKDPVP